MIFRPASVVLLVLAPGAVAAQMRAPAIRVQPTQVAVNSQGATTAILTFSGGGNYTPGQALWCGRVTVVLDLGARCDPATIYGQAPAAGTRAVSSTGTFTDIMSVPASVAQRAYDAAAAGQPAKFYYVRRFVGSSALAGPDQYVVVTCLLGGSGANVPFALTNVRLRLSPETPVLFVKPGDRIPPLLAEISYTGTGRLRGRWEIVLPGEEPPSRTDLMTEGSLPPDKRGLQRRYRELERFNVLLLPTGRYTLRGPDPARLPTSVNGLYSILLRVEASDDPASDTRSGAAAGAPGVIHNGASSGFPMPTMRYVVGDSRTRLPPTDPPLVIGLRLPSSDALVSGDSALTLSWNPDQRAARYRVEIQRSMDGAPVLSAVVAPEAGRYEVPPFVLAKVADGRLRWRVVALNPLGADMGGSGWRGVQRRPR